MKSAAKRRRRLLIGAGLVVLYTLVGFLVLPPVVRSQLEQRLGAELGRRVTVENVRLNPFTLSATLEGFAIRETDGTAAFLSWRSLYVNVDALGSIAGAWTVSDIRLDGFTAAVALRPDGSPNFADILARLTARASAPATPAPAVAPGRPVRISHLEVNGATLAFTDRTRSTPFATTLGPVTFSLQNFSTAPAPGAPYRFEATTEAGERFAWQGTLHPQPLQSAGEFRIENLQLPKYAPYYAGNLHADVTGGTLSLFGRYEVNFAPASKVMKLIDGAVQLRGLKVNERGAKEPAVELAALEFKGLHADALARKAEITTVALTGGQIRARRDANGTLNLQAMVPPPAPGATAAPANTPAAATATEPKPEFKVGAVTLQDGHVTFSDLAAPRPVELTLQNIAFSLQNLTSVAGAQMPLHLALGLGAKGKITVDGEVGLNPLIADVKTTVAGIEVLPFSPYLEEFLNARISQGEFSATLAAQALLADGRQLAAAVAGDVSMTTFGLVDALQNGELAGFQQLDIRGIRASTSAAQGLRIEEIAVAGPYARVVMHADHTLNLATLVRRTAPVAPPAAPATPPPPAAAPAAPAPKIEIGQVVITGGDYRFADRSIEPHVAMALNQFAGTITGLSSTNPAKAVVDLKGKVDGSGPVAITGKLDPLGPSKSVDLKVDFANVDLLPLSPYSGKFAGYELARGKLFLDVKVLVDGKKIDTNNVITLSQFVFGRPVQSPDATKLPVRLGVALLKDLDGKIVIDVPVQGSTDDPDFRISRVVLRVIVNLLTKAAVSPFSLLGAAFGGGGDELAYQDFSAGTSALLPEGLKKLETMTKALQNRPALTVSLEGSFDPAADAFALKRLKLDEKVRRTAWETKRTKDPNIPPPSSLVIAPEERGAALKQLFDAEFPPGTKFGAPVPPPPQPIAPPPAPAGFFSRLISALTGATRREERAVQAANARQFAAHAQAVAAAVATGLPDEEMRQRLAETIAVDDNDLRALAHARAQRVRDHLTATGGIAADRIFLVADTAEHAKPGKGPRVFLSLQ